MSRSEPIDAIPLLAPRDGLPGVTHDDIDTAIKAIASGYGPIAVDTERAMGIRYSDRAYLIQLRRLGAGTFLIDPVGIEDRLAPLAEVMACEWILHAADQDLPCMHQLGLYPTAVFDTEIAALLLGFERVSLQALAAEVLGHALAKELSNSDWSQRPLTSDLLTYAALDVELLHELKDALTDMLRNAGREDWCIQECEAIRTKPPRPAKRQPWRKAANQADIHDRRALAMVEQLWRARDALARKRDVAPSHILPTQVLGALAKYKPRSRADVIRSPLMRSQVRRADAAYWWDAIDIAWHKRTDELPERKFKENTELFPPVKRWGHSHPEAAERWNYVRSSILTWADELGIRQEVLLKPMLQKRIAWEGWSDPDSFAAQLLEWGARPWQVEQARLAILHC